MLITVDVPCDDLSDLSPEERILIHQYIKEDIEDLIFLIIDLADNKRKSNKYFLNRNMNSRQQRISELLESRGISIGTSKDICGWGWIRESST